MYCWMLIFGHFIYFIDYSVEFLFLQDKYFPQFSRVLSFPRFRFFTSTSFIVFKMSTHQTNKANRDLASVGIFTSDLTTIITALPVGKLARVMTPVSLLKACVKYVVLLRTNA